MKRFFYTAREMHTGNLVKGSMEAADRHEALLNLRRQQYLIIDISEYSVMRYQQLWQSFCTRRALSEKEVMLLCRQMAVMLSAGISLADALTMMASGAGKRRRQFLQQTLQQLKEGSSLSDAWRSGVMPEYLMSALRTAEHTGMLAQSLKEAADYFQKSCAEQRRLRRICIYPAFLMTVLAVILIIMVFFVLPVFDDVFARMNIPLPFVTKCILHSGQFLRENLLLIAAGAAMISCTVLCAMRSAALRMRFWQSFARLPLLGSFWRKVHLLSILRQLNFLLQSGIAADESLSIITDSISSEYFKHCMKTAHHGIRQGFSLARSLNQAGLAGEAVLQMIKAGEASGLLAESLHRCCELLSEEIDAFIDDFMGILEPALMLAAGAVVGLFVLSVILPLFEMAGSIGI